MLRSPHAECAVCFGYWWETSYSALTVEFVGLHFVAWDTDLEVFHVVDISVR